MKCSNYKKKYEIVKTFGFILKLYLFRLLKKHIFRLQLQSIVITYFLFFFHLPNRNRQ